MYLELYATRTGGTARVTIEVAFPGFTLLAVCPKGRLQTAKTRLPTLLHLACFFGRRGSRRTLALRLIPALKHLFTNFLSGRLNLLHFFAHAGAGGLVPALGLLYVTLRVRHHPLQFIKLMHKAS